MSVQSTFGSPSRSAIPWPPTTPPIGPETRVVASSRASTEIVPPCAASDAQVEAGAGVAWPRARAGAVRGSARPRGLDQRRVQAREVAPQRIQAAERNTGSWAPAPRQLGDAVLVLELR
jgi:hypothetical protein